MRVTLSRRDLLEKCAGAGLLLLAPRISTFDLAPHLEEGALAPRKPTPPNELGPFYKKRAPRSARLAPAAAPGLPLAIAGQVFDTRGATLSGALLEIWHASHAGIYDNQGYAYRGQLLAGEKGRYAVESVMPGHYPDRVAQHVHFRVSAPGHRTLVTQLYFATDPAFEGDPDKNYAKDPILHSRELIRPVEIVGDPGAPSALVRFELVLAAA
jgi:protocatechuate 3,4-dioxygenase beta subunit